MITRKFTGAIGALSLVAFGLLALASPARAGVGDATWTANGDSSIAGSYTAKLTGGNTSIETADLGATVTADTVVTFKYELLDGAQCTAGAPRVFVVVGGVATNSWDQLVAGGTQCGTDGTVTFTIPGAGTVGAAGLVYDNGGTGSVVVSSVYVGEGKVRFRADPPATTPPATTPPATPTPTPTATATPTASPTPSVSTTTSVSPTPSATTDAPIVVVPVADSDDEDPLPLTGAPTVLIGAIGLSLLLGGAGLWFVARRRQTFTS